jgi:D-glycero-alpha-D-manno-heptose-7-phosphate kinase
MLFTRTPLRISLGGGGSDLPSYYRSHGGFFVSAAIDKYVYIGINKTFTKKYFIRYQSQELVDRVDDIAHPLVREVMRLHDPGPAEIVSLADIPAGTGLGSSGTFTVGLLKALYAFTRRSATAQGIAEEACDIEINRLNEPVGKQDQYIAAIGGITSFEVSMQGEVQATPLKLAPSTLHDLEDNLLLFFTGYSRSASVILSDQKVKSDVADKAMLNNLQSIVEIGKESKSVLERGDTHLFAELMHEHWLKKRVRSAGMSNQSIDYWYDKGMANGALGGKLVGAGGGGFLMFYASDAQGLRAAMAEEGLEEVRFRFDFDGATVITRG